MSARRIFIILLCVSASACTREIASGLDESEANRGVVVLARAGIEAEKGADPATEGRFRLTVTRDEATSAIAILSGEELPRAKPAAPREPGLVASPEAERAARVVATGCVATAIGGVEYQHCGVNYYRAVFEGDSLVYVTAQPTQ